MNKIDELIGKIRNKGFPYQPDWFSEHGIEEAMKEYAEYYARKVLKFVEEECTPDWVHPDDPDEESYIGFEPGELVNIQLPEHE